MSRVLHRSASSVGSVCSVTCYSLCSKFGRLGFVVTLGLVVLGVPAGEATATPYVIRETQMVPEEPTVGELAELRAVIRAEDQEEIRVPDELPNTAWVHVQNVRVVRREEDDELRITFQAFRTGTETLPPIDLGAFVIDDLEVRVASVLEDATQPAGLRPQLVLPRSYALAVAVIIALAALPFLVHRSISLVAAELRRLLDAYRSARPYRRIMRTLRSLHTLVEAMSPRDFYFALMDEVRVYLTARLHADFRVATTTELPLLMEGKIEHAESREALSEVFRTGDLVKFAFARSDVQDRVQHIQRVAELVAVVEERDVSGTVRRAVRPIRRPWVPQPEERGAGHVVR